MLGGKECMSWALLFGACQKLIRLIKTAVSMQKSDRDTLAFGGFWESCSRNWHRFTRWQVWTSQLLAFLWSDDGLGSLQARNYACAHTHNRAHTHRQTESVSVSDIRADCISRCVLGEWAACRVRWPSSAPGKPGPRQQRLLLFVRDQSEKHPRCVNNKFSLIYQTADILKK